MSSVIKKYARYFVLVVATALMLWVLFTWRQLFLPFFVGVVLAYLLFPLVRFIERLMPWKNPKQAGGRRVIAIIIAVIITLALLGLIVYFFTSAIASNSSSIIENASHLIDTAIARIQEWIGALGAGLPEIWQERLDDLALNLGDMIDSIIQDLFTNSGGAITSSFGVIFSFAALPLFLFYMLKDAERFKIGVIGSLPQEIARHTRHITDIIERTLGRYLRAQFIRSMIVALMTFIGLLFIAPVEVAIPLALINGFFKMITTIGPTIGGAIMAIVMLAIAPEMVLWSIILAVVVQLLENYFFAPRIQATALHLHPAVVLFLMVMGSYFWGFWGLVFTAPIVSAFIDVFKYVHVMGNAKIVIATGSPSDSGPMKQG